MKRIKISHLSIAELLYLKRRITEQLKWLQTGKSSEEMNKFSLYEHVTFQTKGFAKVQGTVTRYKDRTVTIISKEGQRRNVNPHLLEKVES